MKKDIHPIYFEKATIICSCGNKIHVGSTEKSIHVEVCSACHPFYTGKQKLLDTAGRVDRFRQRQEDSQAMQKAHIEKSRKPKLQRPIAKKSYKTVKLS